MISSDLSSDTQPPTLNSSLSLHGGDSWPHQTMWIHSGASWTSPPALRTGTLPPHCLPYPGRVVLLGTSLLGPGTWESSQQAASALPKCQWLGPLDSVSKNTACIFLFPPIPWFSLLQNLFASVPTPPAASACLSLGPISVFVSSPNKSAPHRNQSQNVDLIVIPPA